MNEVSTIERGSALANVESSDPVSFIAKLALDERIDEQKLRVLWEIQKDVLAEKRKEQAEAARIAYVAARAKMQQELPIIGRDKENKHDHYHYATLENIWEQCLPVWTAHGFSVSFQSRTVASDLIRVSLQLYHESGHVEEFFAPDTPPDNKGRGGTINKTPIQANQSTVTYIKRGLLCSALGIVTRNEDNDGADDSTDSRQQRATRPQNNGQMRDYVERQGLAHKKAPEETKQEPEPFLVRADRELGNERRPFEWKQLLCKLLDESPDLASGEEILKWPAIAGALTSKGIPPDFRTDINVAIGRLRKKFRTQESPKSTMPAPLTNQFDIHNIDGHHIDGPFLDPREFAERFSEFMGTVPVEDWTATLKVNEVDLIKAKKNDVAAKTLAKLESPA